MNKRYIAPSVKKAFEILRTISSSREAVGVSEIAKDLNMGKSTVLGITSALEEVGAIMRDPLTKRYNLGFTLFELGGLAYAKIDLKDLARPIMEGLMERIEESVFLGALNGGHVTILDIVESRRDLKITSPVGTTIPLLAAATGKVFLAEMDEEQVMGLIRTNGLTRYTENTITAPEKYLQEIRRVRKEGYATDYEEYLSGVRAVASPIRGVGHPMSAIWVVGFKESLDDDKMKTLIGETKAAAEAISRKVKEASALQKKNLSLGF